MEGEGGVTSRRDPEGVCGQRDGRGTRLKQHHILKLVLMYYTSIVISKVICCLSTGVWVEERHFILNDLVLQWWSSVTGKVVCVDHKPKVGAEPLVQVLVARGLV